MRGSAGENLVRPLGEEFQARGVAAGDFEDAPAVVGDVFERAHDGGPFHVALAQLDLEAFPQPGFVALFAAEFLDVEIEHARAEDAQPLLGPAEVDDVADVEIFVSSLTAAAVQDAEGTDKQQANRAGLGDHRRNGHIEPGPLPPPSTLEPVLVSL